MLKKINLQFANGKTHTIERVVSVDLSTTCLGGFKVGFQFEGGGFSFYELGAQLVGFETIQEPDAVVIGYGGLPE